MRTFRLAVLLVTTLLTFGVAQSQVVLNVATGAGNQDLELLQAGADRFMRLNPDVTVRVLLMPELTDNRLVLLQNFFDVGSPELDVLQLDSVWTAELAPHLVDLSGLQTVSNIDPSLLNLLTVEGRLASAPWFVTKGVLVYRSDLLATYGFEAPPSTWSALEDMARTIMAGERVTNADFQGFVFQAGSYEGLTVNALEWWSSTGGGNIIESHGVISIDNPQAAAMLGQARGWIGSISPEAVLNWAESEALDSFTNGDAAFLRGWHTSHHRLSSLPNMVGRYGIAPLPGDGPTGVNGGSGLAVSTYSRHQPEALRLVEFLVSDAEQIRGAVEGARIPTKGGLHQHAEVLQALPFLPAILPELSGPMRPHRQADGLWSSLSRATYLAVHTVLSGYEEPEPTLARLAERLRLSTGLPEGAPFPAP